MRAGASAIRGQQRNRRMTALDATLKGLFVKGLIV